MNRILLFSYSIFTTVTTSSPTLPVSSTPPPPAIDSIELNSNTPTEVNSSYTRNILPQPSSFFSQSNAPTSVVNSYPSSPISSQALTQRTASNSDSAQLFGQTATKTVNKSPYKYNLPSIKPTSNLFHEKESVKSQPTDYEQGEIEPLLSSTAIDILNTTLSEKTSYTETEKETDSTFYEVPRRPSPLRTPHYNSTEKSADHDYQAQRPKSHRKKKEQPPPPYSPPAPFFNMSGSDVITQVSAATPAVADDSLWNNEQNMNEIIAINARGTIIELTRHEVGRLPQCILVGISNSMASGNINNLIWQNTDMEPPYINFPPEFLQYTIGVFRKIASQCPPSVDSPIGLYTDPDSLAEAIKTKPAVIVLREDLDFYPLPPSRTITKKEMNRIKIQCGNLLVKHNRVLDSLRKSNEPGTPEQHLIEMLCSTGFSMDETWGYRQMEPNKTVISSLALVRLRTDNNSKTQKPSINLPPSNADKIKIENESIKNAREDTGNNESQITLANTEVPANSDNINGNENITIRELDTNTENDNIETRNSNGSTTTNLSNESTEVGAEPYPNNSSQQSSTLTPAVTTAGTTGGNLATVSEEDNLNNIDDEEEYEIEEPLPAVDLAQSQKLFLFWRKPARKCWWDTLVFDKVDGWDTPIKVHVRSVWTLELSIID